MSLFSEIIKEICSEESITVETSVNDNIMELYKYGRYNSIIGYTLNLNSEVCSKLCMDKVLLSQFLSKRNIPTIKYQYYTGNNHDVDYNGMLKLLQKYGCFVIKPAISTHGAEVYRVDDKFFMHCVVSKILDMYSSVLVSPYENIEHEYRVIAFDGAIQLIFEKEDMYVFGDGRSTAHALIKEKYGVDYAAWNFIDDVCIVPAKGEKYVLEWRRNIRLGAKATVKHRSTMSSQLLSLAVKTADAIGARFVAIDIIKTVEGYKALSANTDASLAFFAGQSDENRKIAKEVYRQVIRAMFSKD